MTTDRFAVRAVVIFLGVAVLIGLALGGYLAANDHTVPDFIVATVSGALGALAGILASTRGSDEPTPVNVVNVPADPVPVDTTPAPAKKAAPKKR
jgi:hypothetical protein